MKNNLFYKPGFLLLALCLFVFSSCSEDKDEDVLLDDVATTILGTWTSSTIVVEEVTINGESIAEFYSELGLTDEQLELIEGLLLSGFEETSNISFAFNADGTYSAVDEDGSEQGTWEVNSDNSVLTLDEGTEDEFAINVVSISANKFVGNVTETDSSEDIDEDGDIDTILFSLTFTLERS